jgi:hypothetical protein
MARNRVIQVEVEMTNGDKWFVDPEHFENDNMYKSAESIMATLKRGSGPAYIKVHALATYDGDWKYADPGRILYYTVIYP